MYQSFKVKKMPCIYDPDKFRSFCIASGATRIFDNILQSTSTPRRSTKRNEENKKIAVEVIYKMCFAKSQANNYLQKDQGAYFMLKGMNQEALDTERRLGNTCSSRMHYYLQQNIDNSHEQQITTAIEEAAREAQLIICIVDDFHVIHSHRRPENEKLTDEKHMCTIVFKIFPDIPAIPLPEKMEELHNKDGVTSEICQAAVCSPITLQKLGKTYGEVLPDWGKAIFFDSEYERHRLHAHDYSTSENIRRLRSMENLYLLEMKELPLKSFTNFKTALTWICESKMKIYLNKFVLIMPGDWPAQYYLRQVVYSSVYSDVLSIKQHEHENIEDEEAIGTNLDHSSYTFKSYTKPTVTSTPWKREVDSIVPLIGPLHISLNVREDICEVYHEFIKYMYEDLFPGCQLANKPKPWRISLVLEIIYGGWTLIRETVCDHFVNCKIAEYGILLNLLDNYLPLVPSIYSISFKQNNLWNISLQFNVFG